MAYVMSAFTNLKSISIEVDMSVTTCQSPWISNLLGSKRWKRLADLLAAPYKQSATKPLVKIVLQGNEYAPGFAILPANLAAFAKRLGSLSPMNLVCQGLRIGSGMDEVDISTEEQSNLKSFSTISMLKTSGFTTFMKCPPIPVLSFIQSDNSQDFQSLDTRLRVQEYPFLHTLKLCENYDYSHDMHTWLRRARFPALESISLFYLEDMKEEVETTLARLQRDCPRLSKVTLQLCTYPGVREEMETAITKIKQSMESKGIQVALYVIFDTTTKAHLAPSDLLPFQGPLTTT